MTAAMLSSATEEYFERGCISTMDSRTKSILEFYNLLAVVCFVVKRETVPVIIHRMVELSIGHGVTIHSLTGR